MTNEAVTAVRKQTLKGKRWRVQFAAWDFTRAVVPLRRDTVCFSVSLLPAQSHKSTAFSTGVAVYYGADGKLALKLVTDWLGYKPQLSPFWKKLVAAGRP